MASTKKILVTGGCGFIGSALIRHLINSTSYTILNVDILSYAANQDALQSVAMSPRYQFVKADICNEQAINQIFTHFKPDVVMHLAAESHVDKSIKSSYPFIQTNIVGTYNLLEQARLYWQKLSTAEKIDFRFHYISTDEVYGDLPHPEDFTELPEELPLFSEKSHYAPSSPYSASKASGDLLVKAWFRTYGLPVLITHCSNNYGPFQHTEKLIPLTINNAIKSLPITVYGSGNQIRDWLYVEDHVRALILVMQRGTVGETYNIGGCNEINNLKVIRIICSILEELKFPKLNGIVQFKDLIVHTLDRAGHDKRYAIDASKITKELDWKPRESFETGIKKTILWYLNYAQLHHKNFTNAV